PFEPDPHPGLQDRRAVFVTVEAPAGILRGCLGTLEEPGPLAVEVPALAGGAAFRDERFDPLRPADLERFRVKISVLEPPRCVAAGSQDELVAGLAGSRRGVILETLPERRRSVFLPEVWEHFGADAAAFLDALCRKQARPAGFWSAHFPGRVRVLEFGTCTFSG